MAKPKVALWLGTRKGVYGLTSDERRRKWTIRGPFHAGNDVFHVTGDPRDPRYVYALVNSGWFGPRVFRSKDGGRKWTEVAPPMMPLSKHREHDEIGATKAGPIVNLWHLTMGPENEPGTLFLGVDPASLYRSDDRAGSWTGVDGLNQHPTRDHWNPGAGGKCLHTILLDPTRPKRMYAGISAAGVFRSDDGGEHWTPKNRGVHVSFLPESEPEVGQCVHKIALDPANPSTVYRQDHDGIHVSRDSADSWTRIGKVLDHDFGFVVTAPKALPGEAFFAPVEPMSRLAPGGQLQVYRWTERTRKFTPTIRGRPFPGDLGTHREGLDSDWLDPAGLYIGTTTGQLFVSPDSAKSWLEVPYRFPAIHSVSVAPAPTAS
jgi:hypothetical protein